MKTWDEFAKRCATWLPDVPVFTVTDEAFEAARDFYVETMAWRSDPITVATTVVATQDYTITNPADTEIAALCAAWLDGEELDVAKAGELDDYFPGETGTVEKVWLFTPSSVRLLKTPDIAGQVVKATVAYIPKSTATGIADDLFTMHWRPIVHKICGRLMRQKGKPWFDQALAAWHDGQADSLSLGYGSIVGPISRRPYRVKMAPI